MTSQDQQARWGRLLLWLLIISLVGYWAMSGWQRDLTQAKTISYTSFLDEVRAGDVQAVTVQGETIKGSLSSEKKEAAGRARFETVIPPFVGEELLALLEENGVEISAKEPEEGSPWAAILISVLPLLLIIGIGVMIVRGMRAQGKNILSINRSQARLYERSKVKTTFDDVAGAKGAKEELREITEFLRSPQRFERLGGKPPRGVLLVGPPGSGKTLLARAVAGEAEVPFFSISGSDFMEMFVGVGASRVRNMFKEAKKVAPSMIFIDELDSIGRQRGAGLGGGHDEREQTLNQLLSELDGFEPNESVIVIAATNRPDILDKALLRPGRFDRRIIVELPTIRERVEILRIHTRGKPLADDVSLEEVARGTPGFSGADLENLLNEAALIATRKDKDQVEREDIEAARDKVLMGLEREQLALSEEECELLAYHEAGHALVAAVLPHADPVHKVTIVPRGRSMGNTQQLPEREKHLYGKPYLLDRLAVTMGGRAAETLVLHTSTNGAEDDLKQATRLARKMVLDWGMSDRLGYVALGGEKENVFLGEELSRSKEYSEITAREVDEETRVILSEAFNRALSLLENHRAALDTIARRLKSQELLSGEEVKEIISAHHAPLEQEVETGEGSAPQGVVSS